MPARTGASAFVSQHVEFVEESPTQGPLGLSLNQTRTRGQAGAEESLSFRAAPRVGSAYTDARTVLGGGSAEES